MLASLLQLQMVPSTKAAIYALISCGAVLRETIRARATLMALRAFVEAAIAAGRVAEIEWGAREVAILVAAAVQQGGPWHCSDSLVIDIAFHRLTWFRRHGGRLAVRDVFSEACRQLVGSERAVLERWHAGASAWRNFLGRSFKPSLGDSAWCVADFAVGS